jgi:hypothetical protein
MNKQISAVLISGGAEGADRCFEEHAKKAGHATVIYKAASYPQYGPILVKVNKYLKRTYPTTKSYVNQFLERDAKTGSEAESVYAIGYLDAQGSITGGTAWACYVFLEKWYASSSLVAPLYFFDQTTEKWWEPRFTGEGNLPHFIKMTSLPPKPTGKYAGIGSRELLESGKKEIAKLYF